MTLKEIKRRTRNLLCVEFSGNKGHISVCNVLEAIILLVVLILFVGAIASILGAAIYNPDCYTGEFVSIVYIFTAKHAIIGLLTVVVSGLTIYCSVEILKIKVMDCPICGKKEEEKDKCLLEHPSTEE